MYHYRPNKSQFTINFSTILDYKIVMISPSDSTNIIRTDAARTNIANMLFEEFKTGMRIYSGERRECKVCLLGQAQKTEPLIHPCACPSTFELVHVKCFLGWITDKYQETELIEILQSESGLCCDKCKGSYIFHFKMETTFVDWTMFKNKIKKAKLLAAINIAFILIVTFLLIVACSYAIVDRKNPEYNPSRPRFFMVFIAIGLGLCSLGYGIYQFMIKFILFRRLKISLPLNMSTAHNFELKRKVKDYKEQTEQQKASKSQNGLIIPPQLHKEEEFL